MYVFIENIQLAMREDRALLHKYMQYLGMGNGNVPGPVMVVQLFPDRPINCPPIPRLSEK